MRSECALTSIRFPELTCVAAEAALVLIELRDSRTLTKGGLRSVNVRFGSQVDTSGHVNERRLSA